MREEDKQMELMAKTDAEKRLNHDQEDLERKIRNRSAKVGVIGLGYVGLPLAVEMAEKGFRVTGIDIDGGKVESVNAGTSYVQGLPNESLFSMVINGAVRATQSFAAVQFLDAISICVPTPLRKTKSKDPDLSYLKAAVEAVHNHLRPGKLIVLESTTYPGTTREVVLPILQKSGLKVGRDFFLAYSPERADPTKTTYMMRNIPKIVGGITPRCTALAALLYHQFVDRIIPVSSSESAEMVRFLESTFRSVDIVLANEVARMCLKFNAEVWEVLEAVKSKPFDGVSFYSGPRVGLDHYAVDPYYRNCKTRMNGFEPRLLEIAAIIDSQMPAFTVSRIADALNKSKKSLNGSHILVLGIADTSDTTHIRESPSLEIVKGLYDKGSVVSYSDPHVLSVELDDRTLTSTTTTPDILSSADCVVILTDHSAVDYRTIVEHSQLVLDCRNALRKYRAEHVIAL
jgi:UDP-N-acetyl-D-glucosamine dehydrogenase